ncbi:MAG: DUF1272 domain-containing protein [Gammaproteobacteria bacterium]|nr:DUF1272 domain-containing protein [Gammaproteobacteria bacterium]
MLEIRPNCECCDKDLPPDSTEAMICTYECTFCESCVENMLQNVCPNCGGGFVNRPIRPKEAYREGVSLQHQSASNKRVHTPYSIEELKVFAEKFKHIPPEQR